MGWAPVHRVKCATRCEPARSGDGRVLAGSQVQVACNSRCAAVGVVVAGVRLQLLSNIVDTCSLLGGGAAACTVRSPGPAVHRLTLPGRGDGAVGVGAARAAQLPLLWGGVEEMQHVLFAFPFAPAIAAGAPSRSVLHAVSVVFLAAATGGFFVSVLEHSRSDFVVPSFTFV